MLRTMSTLALVLTTAAWCSGQEAKVLLKTELPEEILAGTPPDVLILLFPGLDKPLEKAPEFFVPAGTVNVALNKPATSSDSNPVLGQLSYVTDGKKEGTESNFVELGPLQQWVQIDLGKSCQVYAIYVWHFFREARSYHDMIVQVSDDSQFKKDVRTVFNNDQDNSAELGIGKDRPYIDTNLGRLIDAKGVTGRYVRLYSSGNTANDLNHYVEVEVFGKLTRAGLSETESGLLCSESVRRFPAARAEENLLLAGIHVSRIEAATKQAEAWRHRVEFLQRDAIRLRELQSRSASAQSDCERAEMELQAAESEFRAAEAEVSHLQNYVRAEERALARAKVLLAEAKLGRAKAALQDTVLAAQADGTVLEILKREGEGISSVVTESVLLVADVSKLRVRAEIDERYVHQIQVGQKAKAYGRNLGGGETWGHVAVIKGIMGDKTVFSRASTERKDLDVAQVLIDLDDELRVPVGLRVDVAILVAEGGHLAAKRSVPSLNRDRE